MRNMRKHWSHARRREVVLCVTMVSMVSCVNIAPARVKYGYIGTTSWVTCANTVVCVTCVTCITLSCLHNNGIMRNMHYMCFLRKSGYHSEMRKMRKQLSIIRMQAPRGRSTRRAERRAYRGRRLVEGAWRAWGCGCGDAGRGGFRIFMSFCILFYMLCILSILFYILYDTFYILLCILLWLLIDILCCYFFAYYFTYCVTYFPYDFAFYYAYFLAYYCAYNTYLSYLPYCIVMHILHILHIKHKMHIAHLNFHIVHYAFSVYSTYSAYSWKDKSFG
jgi:hypothetical protein